jgi:hypothetical protein
MLSSTVNVTLVGVAILSAVIYAGVWVRSWPLWSLYDTPMLDYTFISQYTRWGQVQFVGSFALLFALQVIAYRACRNSSTPSTLAIIVAGQVLFGLLNVGIYPIVALDIYDYLMYGRITLVHDGNPFIRPPSAFLDPLVAYSPWPNEPSVYGPLWQLISLVPTALAGDSMLAGMVGFKATSLLFFVGGTLVIWRILLIVGRDRVAPGTVLFAWNPLLQFELVGNAHNDSAMVFLVLLAAWALVAGRGSLVGGLLALAVLTKLLAIALGPLFLIGLTLARRTWSIRLQWIVVGGLSAAVLAVLLYLPFWEGPRTLHFLTRGNWFTASFPTLLREVLRRLIEFEEAGRLAATITGAAFATFVSIRCWLLYRQQRSIVDGAAWHRAWLLAAHDVTFAYLAFACIWWEPWYLAWLVAFAALVDSWRLHARALLFCFGGVLNYVVFKYWWSVLQPMTYTEIMSLSVVMIFGLPLLHLAWEVAMPDLHNAPLDRSSES